MMKKRAVLIFLILLVGLCLFTLSGCFQLFGAVFVKPGETVVLISASTNQVTYEYTHSYDSELPYAGRAAEEQCNRFDKHAALSGINQKNLDRSLVTFRCE
jgi:hypothetical protein